MQRVLAPQSTPFSTRAAAVSTLRRLHETASPDSHRDGTVYGLARSATTSFHAHHLRLISLAIHRQNMDLLLAGADREAVRCISLSPTLPGASGGVQCPSATEGAA